MGRLGDFLVREHKVLKHFPAQSKVWENGIGITCELVRAAGIY
jgi:hypothetical protein